MTSRLPTNRVTCGCPAPPPPLLLLLLLLTPPPPPPLPPLPEGPAENEAGVRRALVPVGPQPYPGSTL